MHFTTFVDVKSEELRDILREVLKDISTVCLREDKPTVRDTFVKRKTWYLPSPNFSFRSDRKSYSTLYPSCRCTASIDSYPAQKKPDP